MKVLTYTVIAAALSAVAILAGLLIYAAPNIGF